MSSPFKDFKWGQAPGKPETQKVVAVTEGDAVAIAMLVADQIASRSNDEIRTLYRQMAEQQIELSEARRQLVEQKREADQMIALRDQEIAQLREWINRNLTVPVTPVLPGLPSSSSQPWSPAPSWTPPVPVISAPPAVTS